MSQEFSELDRELATKKFETMAYSIEQLTARGELGRKNPGTIEAQMEQDRPPSKPIIPEKLEFRIEQDELNALLSSKEFSAGDLKSTRVQILSDRIRLGAEVQVSDETSIPFVVDLRISSPLNHQVKLEVVGGQVGRVPVPLPWLMKQLPDDLFRDAKFETHFSEATPFVLLNIGNRKVGSVTLNHESGALRLSVGAE